MTGELYALLTQHGILGRLMQFGGAFEPAAFDDGVLLGVRHHAELPHTLFAARTAGLMGQRSAQALPDFLSGVLIGAEVAGARRRADVSSVTLLGDGALCDRYARALQACGVAVQRAAADATTRGQWRVARAARLLQER
jgi:2-dehydro-3-deoxygalactonokinase